MLKCIAPNTDIILSDQFPTSIRIKTLNESLCWNMAIIQRANTFSFIIPTSARIMFYVQAKGHKTDNKKCLVSFSSSYSGRHALLFHIVLGKVLHVAEIYIKENMRNHTAISQPIQPMHSII